ANQSARPPIMPASAPAWINEVRKPGSETMRVATNTAPMPVSIAVARKRLRRSRFRLTASDLSDAIRPPCLPSPAGGGAKGEGRGSRDSSRLIALLSPGWRGWPWRRTAASSQNANALDWQFPQSDPKWKIFNPGKGASDMIPVAYIEHQLPGRVRLRIPSRRGEVPFFEKVVRELSKHPAIRDLTATPLTGSITLQHFEPLQPIIAAAADQKLFETS